MKLPYDRNLDTSSYDKLVAQHALAGLARGEAFLDWIGTAKWSVDVPASTITIPSRGTFPIHILGSFSAASKTFLWSWANATITACAPKAYALSLRTSALQDPGLSPFVERKLTEKWVGYRELVAVVSDMAKLPAFEAPDGAGIALLLVDNGQPAPTLRPPLAARVIAKDLDRVVAPNPYELVERFLETSGYRVTPKTPTRLEAQRGVDRLAVEWRRGLDNLPEVTSGSESR